MKIHSPHKLLAISLFALVLCLARTGVAEEESPGALFKRVVDNIPRVPFTANMKLTNEHSVRELELHHKLLNDNTYGAYLVVTSPKDVAGTRFLLIERTEGADEQYVLVPQVARVMKLMTNNREQQQLLGSEFYVSDLNLPDPNQLDSTFAGEETIAGRACKLINVVAKPDAQWAYKKARYAVDPIELVVVRAELEDEKGPFKLWTLDKGEKIDGIWTSRLQTMKNVRDKVESKLEIVDIKYRVELADEMFTRKELERNR